jgi:hypothetical protein
MKQFDIEMFVASLLLLILACGAFIFVRDSTKTPTPSSTPGSSTTAQATHGAGSSTTAQSQQSAPSCISASQAVNNEDNGQSECVQFVGYAYTSSRGEMYLDQATSAPYGFSVYIPAGYSFGPSLLNKYSGESIDVTGSITNYRGEPEIEVTSPSQVQAAP